MIRIDKSKFNPEQLAEYEKLVAIGKADVDPEAAEEKMTLHNAFPGGALPTPPQPRSTRLLPGAPPCYLCRLRSR